MSGLSPNWKRVFLDALAAGIELAIVRNNLEMEGGKIPAPSDAKRMAKDAVNAMQGIDTCDPQPVAEWNALVDLLFDAHAQRYRQNEALAKHLRTLCYCSWHKRGQCPHCPTDRSALDKFHDRGSAVPSSVCQCNDGPKAKSQKPKAGVAA